MEEHEVEALRQRYRREARAAVEAARRSAREECLAEVQLRVKTLEDEARKWKAVAEAVSANDVPDPKTSSLTRYVMETVYRDLKRECECLPNKAEVLACIKKSLIISTEKLDNRLPQIFLCLQKPVGGVVDCKASEATQPFSTIRRPRCLELGVKYAMKFVTKRVMVEIGLASDTVKGSGLFGKDVTMYEVNCLVFSNNDDDPPTSHITLRRYNNFVDFHKELSKKYSNFIIPHLPPKLLLKDKSDGKAIVLRQLHLKLWLRYILEHPILQNSCLTESFMKDNKLNLSALSQCSSDAFDHGIIDNDVLYEQENDFKGSKNNSDENSKFTCVRNKFVEALRNKCVRELHTISRDFEQLLPNIEAVMSTLSSLSDASGGISNSLGKLGKSFSNLSDCEESEIERKAASHMDKVILNVKPVLCSISDSFVANVVEPFQFLESDTMKCFQSVLHDLQLKSVESHKSRNKNEKYLRAHRITVNEWVTFRKTRHNMLAENLANFVQDISSNSARLVEFWTQAKEEISKIQIEVVGSSLVEAVADEKAHFRSFVNEINLKHEESVTMTHAAFSRPTVPSGKRRGPSFSVKPDWLSEPVVEEKFAEEKKGSSKDKSKASGWLNYFSSIGGQEQYSSVQNKHSDSSGGVHESNPSGGRKESERTRVVSCDDEETPMTRAYKEQLKKQVADEMAKGEPEQASNDEIHAKDVLNQQSRRRLAPTGGPQRRLKPLPTPSLKHAEDSKANVPDKTNGNVAPAVPTPSAPQAKQERHSVESDQYSRGRSSSSAAKETSGFSRRDYETSSNASVPSIPVQSGAHDLPDGRFRSKSNATLPVNTPVSRPRKNSSSSIPENPQHSFTSSNASMNKASDSSQEKLTPLPQGWEEVLSAEGHRYYYHKTHRVSQWERPVECDEEKNGNNKMHNKSGENSTPMSRSIYTQQESKSSEVEHIEAKVKNVVMNWSQKPSASNSLHPKLKTVPELLASLNDVLKGVVVVPDDLSKSLKTLCNVSPLSDIKKCYMRVIRLVHPDKIAASADLEKKILTENIFICLSQEYDSFRKANGL